MSLYKLYLESGPRLKKTMVHVLGLLGCIANAPTTDDALDKTPGAIREFLYFLYRHGTQVDLEAPVETQIVEHITEGVWLGNGDPSLVFEPDLEPFSPDELETLIERLEWMRCDMVDLVNGLSTAQRQEKPQPRGRSIQEIMGHILESEYAYMRAFGKLEGLPGLGSIVKKKEGDMLDWMGYVREREIERLRSLDEQQLSEPFIHWKYTRTARKVMRRMLEHQWEHLVEIRLMSDNSTAAHR